MIRIIALESSPPSTVVLKLDFSEPFEAHNVVAFTLTPQGDATEVSWDMRGPTPFLAKLVNLEALAEQ